MVKLILNNIFYYGNFILFYLIIFYFFLKKFIPFFLKRYEIFKMNKFECVKSVLAKRNDFIRLEHDYFVEKRKLDLLEKKIKLFLVWKKEKNILINENDFSRSDFFLRQKKVAKICLAKNLVLTKIKDNLSREVALLFKDSDDIDFVLSFLSKKEK